MFRLTLVLLLAAAGYAQAQNAIAISASGQQPLALHGVTAAFVSSNATNAKEALKDGAIGHVEGQVIGAVAGQMLPIPVVGALPIQGITSVFGKFRKRTVKGFSVLYLPGLTAETTVASSPNSLLIPDVMLKTLAQPSAPLLVRVTASAKDSARIVRMTRVELKTTNSSITPVETKVLETSQEIVACRTEKDSNGDLLLTPDSPLQSGEYALLVPARVGSEEIIALAWDFRVGR